MRDLTMAMPTGLARKKSKSSTSTKILNLSIFCGILLFGLVYLFEINALGTKGYEIRGLEQQVRQVEQEQKNLEVESLDLQSSSRVQDQVQSLNFVPATNITYLKDSDFALK